MEVFQVRLKGQKTKERSMKEYSTHWIWNYGWLAYWNLLLVQCFLVVHWAVAKLQAFILVIDLIKISFIIRNEIAPIVPLHRNSTRFRECFSIFSNSFSENTKIIGWLVKQEFFLMFTWSGFVINELGVTAPSVGQS